MVNLVKPMEAHVPISPILPFQEKNEGTRKLSIHFTDTVDVDVEITIKKVFRLIISDLYVERQKISLHLNPIFRLIHSKTGRMIPIKNGLVKILVCLV